MAQLLKMPKDSELVFTIHKVKGWAEVALDGQARITRTTVKKNEQHVLSLAPGVHRLDITVKELNNVPYDVDIEVERRHGKGERSLVLRQSFTQDTESGFPIDGETIFLEVNNDA